MLQPFEILPKRIPIRPGALAMVLFGLVPLIYGLFFASQSFFWLIKGVPATGTIVRLAASQDSNGDISYSPVISFKTAAGATVEFQSADGGSPTDYPVGETLPIRYEQDHPQNAHIADFASLGFPPIFPLSVGILFILAGMAVRRPGSRFSLRPIYVIGAFFLGVGLLFVVLDIMVAAQSRQLEQHATASATGTVIDCVYDNTSQRTCIPTIRFTPANGAAITFKPPSYSDNLKMGDSVSVRYNPADPNEALLAASSNSVLFFIFGGLGGLFVIIGLIVEVIAIRNRHRPDTSARYATNVGTIVRYAGDTETGVEYAGGTETGVRYVASIGTGVPRGVKIQSPVVLFCLFLFFAIIFFGLGVIFLNQSINFQRTATGRATGTIVHCDESTSANDSNNSTTTSCSPTIRFVTGDGRTIEFIPSESSSSFEVGQSIPVIYNPHAPEQARISSFFDLWMFPIVFLAFGSIFIALTCVAGFFMLKRIFGHGASGENGTDDIALLSKPDL